MQPGKSHTRKPCAFWIHTSPPPPLEWICPAFCFGSQKRSRRRVRERGRSLVPYRTYGEDTPLWRFFKRSPSGRSHAGGAEAVKFLNLPRSGTWQCSRCLPRPPPMVILGVAGTIPKPVPIAVPRFASVLFHGARVWPGAVLLAGEPLPPLRNTHGR